MTAQDLWILSPHIALATLGLVAIVVDLALSRRRVEVLTALVVIGLLVPAGLSVALWVDLQDVAGRSATGVYGTVRVDEFSVFFQLLVLAVTALVALASFGYVRNLRSHHGEYFALVLLSAVGMTLLASATELISLYIALELTSLPIVALAGYLSTGRSSESGLKYLVLSATSSAFLLYGVALVYGMTGTTQLDEIARVAADLGGNGFPFASPALLLGAVFIAAGFGFKVSSVPFQMWAPDVYQGSPTPVVAFLSVASKAAGFAALLRVFYTAFPTFSVDWGTLFAALALLSMFVGNLAALVQDNLKRLLGYSTIAHAGYLLVGLAAVTRSGGEALGPSALLFYLVAYGASNLAAFFAIIAITSRVGAERIDDFAGLGRRAPWMGAALALAMLALIGLPPTGIFLGKLYLFTAAVRADLAWLAVAGLVASVISAYYYLRVVRALYLSETTAEGPVGADWPVRVAMGVAAVGVLLAGLVPGPVLDAARSATATLVGG